MWRFRDCNNGSFVEDRQAEDDKNKFLVLGETKGSDKNIKEVIEVEMQGKGKLQTKPKTLKIVERITKIRARSHKKASRESHCYGLGIKPKSRKNDEKKFKVKSAKKVPEDVAAIKTHRNLLTPTNMRWFFHNST